MLMETDQPHYGSKYKQNSPDGPGLQGNIV